MNSSSIWLRVGLFVLTVFLFSGCSSEEAIVSEAAVLSTTTSLASTTTTTTVESSTSTEPAMSDEQDVRDLHAYYVTEFSKYNELETGVESRISEAETFMVDPLLSRLTKALRDDAEVGSYGIGPGSISNVVEVEMGSDTATVTDCSQGLEVGYYENGDVAIAADDFFKLRVMKYVKVDGDWKLADRQSGERCDPSDY